MRVSQYIFFMLSRQYLTPLELTKQFTFQQKDKKGNTHKYERNKTEVVKELLNFYKEAQRDDRDRCEFKFDRFETKQDQIVEEGQIQKRGEQFYLERSTKEIEPQHLTLNEYFSNKKSQERSSLTPKNNKVDSFTQFSPEDRNHILNQFTKQKTFTIDLINYHNVGKEESKSKGKKSVISKYMTKKSKCMGRQKERSKSNKEGMGVERSPAKFTIEKITSLTIQGTSPVAIKKKVEENSRSVIMVTESNYISPEELESKGKNRNNNILDQLNEEEMIDRLVEIKKRQREQKIKQGKKSKQKQSGVNIQIDIPQLFHRQQKQMIKSYNYDDSEHIFDKIQEKSITAAQVQFKTDKKQIENYFHIKNEEKFNRQIEEKNKNFKEKMLKEVSVPSKHRLKVFDSNEQRNLNMKEEEERIIKYLLQDSQGAQQNLKQSLMNERQRMEQEEGGSFHIFDFLKQKLTFLGTTSDPKAEAPIKEEGHNSSSKLEQEAKIIQKHLSKQSSSSSFFKQKQKISENGVKNIDLTDLVGQTVKIVSVNLEKASEKIKNSKIRQEKQSQKEAEQHKTFQEPSKCNIKPTNSVNFSSGFFESSNNNEELLQSRHISTVQKIQSHSADKSDFLNQNFQQMKDDSVIANLCQKISSQKGSSGGKIEKQDESKPNLSEKRQQHQNISQKVEQDHQQSIQLSKKESKNQIDKKSVILQYSPEYHFEQEQIRPKQIHIDLNDFPSLTLSGDAVSYSKIEEKIDEKDPTLNSFKIQSKEKEKVNEVKAGKVRKIQINFESSSDESYDSLDESSETEVNLSEIKDYSSDEEEDDFSNPARMSTHTKDQHFAKLFPVVEQELQQSEVVKNQKTIKTNNQTTKIPSNIDLKKKKISKLQDSEVRRQLQDEFLNDFPMQKKESEVEPYKYPLNDESKGGRKEKKSIKIKLKGTESKILGGNQKSSSSSVPSYHSSSNTFPENKDEKEMIEDIKGDINKLKNKMSSSFNLDISKISSKGSHKEGKKIEIDLTGNLELDHRNSNESQQMDDRKQRNEEGKNSNLFREFREDILTLQKKMEQQSSINKI